MLVTAAVKTAFLEVGVVQLAQCGVCFEGDH